LGTPGEEVRTTPAQQKDLFQTPQRSRKDRVDRQRVFEEGMKVTRAVQPTQQRAESAAGDEPRRSVSTDAKTMEALREKLTTRNGSVRWYTHAAALVAAVRKPMALKAP
jgi:hypothetical protein